MDPPESNKLHLFIKLAASVRVNIRLNGRSQVALEPDPTIIGLAIVIP